MAAPIRRTNWFRLQVDEKVCPNYRARIRGREVGLCWSGVKDLMERLELPTEPMPTRIRGHFQADPEGETEVDWDGDINMSSLGFYTLTPYGVTEQLLGIEPYREATVAPWYPSWTRGHFWLEVEW